MEPNEVTAQMVEAACKIHLELGPGLRETMQMQVSILTFCTFCFSHQVWCVAPTAHVQPPGGPFPRKLSRGWRFSRLKILWGRVWAHAWGLPAIASFFGFGERHVIISDTFLAFSSCRVFQ
jgi:hypothetical protein